MHVCVYTYGYTSNTWTHRYCPTPRSHSLLLSLPLSLGEVAKPKLRSLERESWEKCGLVEGILAKVKTIAHFQCVEKQQMLFHIFGLLRNVDGVELIPEETNKYLNICENI